jgi:hypothetical protein
MNSNIEKAVRQLQLLADRMPRPECAWEVRPRFDPPASPTMIANFERVIGFPLPLDFKQFLTLNEAVIAMDVHNGYWLGGIDRVDLSAFPQEVTGEKVAPIATDGGGNAFLITANGNVWHRNHETQSSKEVAKSFSIFLDRVVADWKAYLEDTPGWSYLV